MDEFGKLIPLKEAKKLFPECNPETIITHREISYITQKEYDKIKSSSYLSWGNKIKNKHTKKDGIILGSPYFPSHGKFKGIKSILVSWKPDENSAIPVLVSVDDLIPE